LTHADSAKLRDYLDAFNGTDGRNEGIAPIVAATATISAARLQTPTLKTALDNYFQSTDPYVREIAVRAAGMTSDTVNFYNLLASMPAVTALEEVPRLEALDSMWRRATRGPNPDTAFRAALERTHAANVYRTMLMRVSDVVYDPAVATLALAHLQDSTIVVDTFRTQAQDYVRKYLRAFADRQFRDELLAAVSAEAWFRDPSAEVPALLRTDYDSARQWHDVELMDSIKSALQAIGENTTRLKSPLPIISNIDWTYLESLPDKMLFGLERGAIQLRLHTFETPLTVLNMARLAKQQFFPGQRFHRVVPNFVVQSGDPTGTGYGGPDYAIRTEITPTSYDREGMVGMASSGKDTEGSQWFITECPTPHLDGHYTLWGDVVGGLNEVMKLQVGDKITSSLTFH
ncbi:MAG: peptidylprolyl isomerase, partial [Bacteroidota bacterium]|nr:peptidylprolyl isomerase [Bacteroidota bacterium]